MKDKLHIPLLLLTLLFLSCNKDCLKKNDCELSNYSSSYLQVYETPEATGTTYYIDAKDGKKKNSGTSEGEAFKEIEQLEGISFNPGDQILFKRGQVHYGLLELNQGGNETEPIYIADYGEGHLPVVKSEDGDNDKSDKFTIFLKEANYIVIQNLNIQGGGHALTLSNSDYVKIQGCRIGERSNSGIRATAEYTNGDGSDYGELQHCLIYSGLSGNLGDRQSTDGIQLMDGASNWNIHDNEFKAWAHSGVSIKQLYSFEENNENIISGNLFSCGDIDYMRALDISGGEELVAHNVFTKNIIRDQSVTSHIHGNNNVVSYNLFLKLKVSSATQQPWALDLHVFNHQTGAKGRQQLVCHDNSIHNNLIYSFEGGEGIRVLDSQNGASFKVENNQIANNIFYNTAIAIKLDSEPFAVRFENNIVYNTGGNEQFSFNGTTYNLQAFESVGQNNHVFQLNSLANPIFINAASEDFTLMPASPAIDAGIDLGATSDFNGNTINGLPDIGPFEF